MYIRICSFFYFLFLLYFFLVKFDTVIMKKKLVRTEFWGKCLPQYGQNGPEMAFFAFFEKFCHYFLLEII